MSGRSIMIRSYLSSNGLKNALFLRDWWYVHAWNCYNTSRNHGPTIMTLSRLLEAVQAIKPTVLIGTSGVGQTFTQEVVEAMTSFNEKHPEIVNQLVDLIVITSIMEVIM